MRMLRTMLIATCSLLLVAVAALAQADLSGKWVIDVALDAGSGQATFDLMQADDGTLSGTYGGVLGEISVTGSVSGEEFTLSFDSEAGEITYKGKLNADGTAEGTCEYGQLGGGTFKGTRSETSLHP